MLLTSDISSLLNTFAKTHSSPFVPYNSFVDYIKRYAQHHCHQIPGLTVYLENTASHIDMEFEPLIEASQIVVSGIEADKTIFVLSRLNSQIADAYRRVTTDPAIPLPTTKDIPQNMPMSILRKAEYGDVIFDLLKNDDEIHKPAIYLLNMPRELPPILFPNSISVNTLISISFARMQQMLLNNEYYEYYMKKLLMSNPRKEVAARNFYTQFAQSPDTALSYLKTSNDWYYFWGQLCNFIKMDYDNVKDYKQNDINILQALFISEIVISFYRNQSAKIVQNELALKSVKSNMLKPPYFFTIEGILNFTDANGVPLQGKYDDKSLKDFLQRETTEAQPHQMPNLLTFKTESGGKYFIYKENVIPLVLRLCDEMHDTVQQELKETWYAVLKNYRRLAEMESDVEFNNRIEKEVRGRSPVLYSLLNAPFLSVLNDEFIASTKNNYPINLFSKDRLLPYSSLLMLNRTSIYKETKNLLPFWYSIPLFVWLMNMFFQKPKTKTKKSEQEQDSEKYKEALERKKEETSSPKRSEFVSAAAKLERSIVPEGSTIERELASYQKQWNMMLTKEAALNLKDDVNSLIRDYTRNVVKTLNSKHFTIDRIQNLARTFCGTKNMQKIHDQGSLYMYVQLYMIYLVKNM